MAANGISTLSTKTLRQVAKLDLAQAKRKGQTITEGGGTWSTNGVDDDTQPYYRSNNTYNLTSLPNIYVGNAPADPDANPNPDGLIQKRPWIAVGAIAAPISIAEAVDGGTLPDLQVWYDGADTSTYIPSATDEAQITQWTDKSNFAHNANPNGGSAKPTYENTTLQNGYGYLEFDGNDSLSVNPFTTLASQTGFTIFVVAKALTTTGSQYLIETDQNDLRVSFNGTEVVTGMATGGTQTSGGLGFDTDWHVHTFVFDGSGAPDPAATNLYRLDKTSIVTTGGTGPATTDASNTTLYIGNSAAGTDGWTGYIGEVILFSRTLSATEYGNVENYLTNKWGL